MEKEKVESIVRDLMKRLHISMELEEIIRAYNKSYDEFQKECFGKKPNETDKESGKENETDNEKQVEASTNVEIPQKDENEKYPWVDVIASMMEHPESVHYAETVCPDCGKKHLRIWFSSPCWTWGAMLGLACSMDICLGCLKQTEVFDGIFIKS